jgi:hypothetical protein
MSRSEAAIVSEAVSHRLQSHLNTSRTLIGAQIPEAWLQTIPGVRFNRLTDEAALDQFQHCGQALWVDSLKVGLDGTAVIAVAEGHSCQFSGQEYRLHRSPDGWRFDGLGSTFGYASSGCACQ